MISTKGRYALRVMLDLAQNNGENFITIKEISARQDISPKYLEQIFSILNRAGFLLSSRGAGGGYKLAKQPYEYIVGDILRATEGSLAPIACLGENAPTCERSGECPTLPFWKGLYKTINDYVDGVTLDDLLTLSATSSPEYNI